VVPRCDHRWHNDNDQEDDDANNDTHAHLHVLPPHLLPHAVCAAPEAVGLRGQRVGLVLQGVEALTTLGDFRDVLLHLRDGAVDFLYMFVSGGQLEWTAVR